jgi:hypothetical protein
MAIAHLFLNQGKTFWSIPNTEIRLSRQHPWITLTDEDQAGLTNEQFKMINDSLAVGTIVRIKEEFLNDIKKKTPAEFIVSKSISEIQKGYIGPLVVSKDIEGLESIKSAESNRDSPREDVIKMIDLAMERIFKRERDSIAIGLAAKLKSLPDEEDDEFEDFDENDLLGFTVQR